MYSLEKLAGTFIVTAFICALGIHIADDVTTVKLAKTFMEHGVPFKVGKKGVEVIENEEG